MVRLTSSGAALLVVGCIASAADFDVASLKQVQLPKGNVNSRDLTFVGKGGVPFKVVRNRITLQGNLRRFIVAAYGVRDYQVTGMPSWSDSVVFNLTAKSPGDDSPATAEVRSMLQSPLADRFQLKFHRESKEMHFKRYHRFNVD